MPQMAPLNWIMLFMFFLTIYLLVIIVNYFSYILQIKTPQTCLKKNNLTNWKL